MTTQTVTTVNATPKTVRTVALNAAPRWRPDAAGVLAGLSLLVVAALWVTNRGVQQVMAGGSEALTALGRLTGLLSADLLLLQVLLMARIPLAERAFGQDRLARWHRWTGFASFHLMVAHIVLTMLGYGELWDMIILYPGMLLATAGTLLIIMVVVTSLRAARRRRRYESAAEKVAAVFADLCHADEVFSTYREDSELSRWERGELGLGEADATLAEVLALCDEARERTHGWFDPRGLPDPFTGLPRFDPSGLVKGWAVQRAARHLSGLDGYAWCLNAGGDVLVHSPDGYEPWRIGIEDPGDPRRILRVVSCGGGAVATSGSAQRGTHIINPHTGKPADAVLAVSVTGPELLWADVYATAAVAWGPEALAWLENLPGYEALTVVGSGPPRATMGWA